MTKTQLQSPGAAGHDERGSKRVLATLSENLDDGHGTEPNSHDIQGHTARRKIGVFISYNHRDLVLANVLRQCLITLSSDLDPFLDHVGLQAGDEYEKKLAESIGTSQWFIMLCSGPLTEKDMSWCLYEAGQFRRKLLEEGREKLIRSRLFVIYDDEMPRPLAHLQGVRMSGKDIFGQLLDLRTDKPAEELEDRSIALFENTQIFDCLKTIISESRKDPLRDLSDANVRSILKTNSRTLISAFLNYQVDRKLAEIVFQPRICFWLCPPGEQSPRASRLKADTAVTGDGDTLSRLFGLFGKETTWGMIKARCRDAEGNDPVWADEIEAAAEEVSMNHEPKQPDGLHRGKGDQKFYRVLFARCDPFTSGSRLCYILYIPRSSRDFDVRERTSILLSALILSIRFRQRILPFTEKLQELARKDKINGVLEVEKKLLEIETESLEFGLEMSDEDHDEAPLVRVFREGENKSFVERAIVSWQASRRALADVFKTAKATEDRIQVGADGADSVVRELKKYQEINGKFIGVLTEELLFVEKVTAGKQ
jgi:hypothetical protein